MSPIVPLLLGEDGTVSQPPKKTVRNVTEEPSLDRVGTTAKPDKQ